MLSHRWRTTMSDPLETQTEDTKATDWRDLPSLYAKRRERRAAGERDAQPIGDLTRPIVDAASNSGSTSRQQSSNSEITGALCPDQRVSSSTGKQLSTIDAAKLLAVETAWQARDAEALDTHLHRLLKPHATSIEPLMSADFDVLGYRGRLPESLRPLVERINAPAGPKMVNGAAARCLSVTKSRATDGMDLRMMLAIFADELAQFPEDVVATAFRKWARREKWWPSLAEILDQCQRLNRVRASLARAA